ncbi:hypothetical protein P0136_13285 [Lentisphaerota bacterium ZTH]|nr:hypothetical protein JYG24_09200 [Lentisphaerota bacterium]WET06332.1 hypothetical protein P0136_13285 [Lentisphaerota bacterium ZTH]
MRCDLSSADSSDLWKTSLGFKTLKLHQKSPLLGLPAVAFLRCLNFAAKPAGLKSDMQEYPEVRANCALALMNINAVRPEKRLKDMIYRHLYWLTTNECPVIKAWGDCREPGVGRLEHSIQNALAVVTAVCTEAFCEFKELEKSNEFDTSLNDCKAFLLSELQGLDSEFTEKNPAAPCVQAAVMKALARLYQFAATNEKKMITLKVKELYSYLKKSQLASGSWPTQPQLTAPANCRCNCNIIRDIAATATRTNLPGAQKVINKGWRYVISNLFCERKGIFKRLSDRKLSRLCGYALSDNAAALHAAVRLGSIDMARHLNRNIEKRFIKFGNIYTRIDHFGLRKNKDYLRDGISAYLLALSELLQLDII